MKHLILLLVATILLSCQDQTNSSLEEKQQIIQTLQNETKYFCERNLAAWQDQWSHQPFVTKMYAGKTDFEEFIGWQAILQFTTDHIASYPQPIPIPDTSFDYDIYLFTKTALVYYSKTVDGKTVRETRFMVKEDNKWKIGRMQTTY